MTYNLNALRTAGAEAEPIKFELDGTEFTIPAPTAWPDAALEAAQAGEVIALGKSLLGEQYEGFTSLGGRSLDLALILEAHADAEGIELGE